MDEERQSERGDESETSDGAEGRAVATNCYRCGATIPPGVNRCPRCGRRQTRWCYCGHEIPVVEASCPHCGADWSKAVRVRRRVHRSRWERGKLIGYMSAGAVIAVLAAALLNSIVGALALRSLPAGERILPPDFSSRLGLAVETIGHSLAAAWNRLAGVGGSLWGILVIVFVGAVGGALVYLARVGRISLSTLRPSKARQGRRTRR